MPTTRTRSPLAAAAALALAASLLLGACGDGGGDDDAAADPTEQVDPGAPAGDDLDDLVDDLDSTAPEVCRERFPLELEPASLDELTHVPDGWPEAPEGSTLCSAQATIDGSTETAAYVTDLEPAEVIAHYRDLLGDEFQPSEGEGSLGGPALTGTVGTTGWQVETRSDGTFQLGFGEA